MALCEIDGFHFSFNVPHAHFLSMFFKLFLLLSRVCSLTSTETIMWNVPEEKTAKTYLKNGKWIQRLPKGSLSPSCPLSLSLFLSAAVFHYQCPNQLVKKSETQTTVLKITEFHHKCPTLPAATLGFRLEVRPPYYSTHTNIHPH